MNEMTLPSRYEWMGKKHFCFFIPPRQGNELGNEPGISVKGSGATATLGPAPIYIVRNITENRVIRHRTDSLDI